MPLDRKLIAEILAAHADRLVRGQKAKAREILSLFSEAQETLQPLVQVAEEVEETLKPVSPTPSFREELEDRLLAEAQKTLAAEKPTPSMGRSIVVIIAAALGSLLLSIVGLILYFFRGRKPPRAQPSS